MQSTGTHGHACAFPRNDIVEVKSLQNPPAGVKLVMETACIMFDEKPKMKEDPAKMGGCGAVTVNSVH